LFALAAAVSMTVGTVAMEKNLCDCIETLNDFCYLVDRLNASGGSELAVMARTRIGCVPL